MSAKDNSIQISTIQKSRMRRRNLSDNILKAMIWSFAFITVAVLAWILVYILSRGIPYISWKFLSSDYSSPAYGIFPMIVGTLYLVILTVAIAAPIGICSAIYLVEYAKQGVALKILRFATESLAGIPSIIYGLFGYIFFVLILHFKFSLLSGALTVSIMVLPTIIRTTEEALKTVPSIYREGSLALGATRLQTIYKIILPCSIPGILTAVILSIGRIVGETAAVFYTMGMALRIPNSISSSGRTLSVHLYMLAKEGSPLEQSYATATVLIIIVAIINFAATRIASGIGNSKVGRR